MKWKWYNYAGLAIILQDLIGGFLGLEGYIFKGWDLTQGAALFIIVMIVGIGLTIIDFSFEDKDLEMLEED